MLRACVLEHQGSWDQNLPWAEFSYNNSYQESLKMALFNVLYKHQCRTPLNWIERKKRLSLDRTLLKKLKQPFIISKIT
jgi:hypothetical protein